MLYTRHLKYGDFIIDRKPASEYQAGKIVFLVESCYLVQQCRWHVRIS